MTGETMTETGGRQTAVPEKDYIWSTVDMQQTVQNEIEMRPRSAETRQLEIAARGKKAEDAWNCRQHQTPRVLCHSYTQTFMIKFNL